MTVIYVIERYLTEKELKEDREKWTEIASRSNDEMFKKTIIEILEKGKGPGWLYYRAFAHYIHAKLEKEKAAAEDKENKYRVVKAEYINPENKYIINNYRVIPW
jgi:regulator of RNase E activity RraB